MGRRESEAKRREWADGKASAESLQRKMKNTKTEKAFTIITYSITIYVGKKDKADWLSS